jgi:hypothetical protein
MTCRFEIRIRKTQRFQCAAKFGFDGHAYLWAHDDLHDPCPGCPIMIEGKLSVIEHELKPAEFASVAGKRIRRTDWIEIERRGYKIARSGIEKTE